MDARKAFEEWATAQGINITRDGFGGYEADFTDGALEGWNAAQAHAAPAYNRDVVVVNLMRLANIDKHLARDIADAAWGSETLPHQAARVQALEEAAKVCDRTASDYKGMFAEDESLYIAARDCADAIRALIGAKT